MYLDRKKRLLILGPSFRRNRGEDPLTALNFYDGLFFRIAKKYLEKNRSVDVLVMIDDLTLVDSKVLLYYNKPKGEYWGNQKFLKLFLENAKVKNEIFLRRKLKNLKYSEIFLSMGKIYAKALPDFSQFEIKVIFPTKGGLGPKALALKNWFLIET